MSKKVTADVEIYTTDIQLQQGIRVFVNLVLPDFEFSMQSTQTCCPTLLLVLSLQMYFQSLLLSTQKVLRSQATSSSSFSFYGKYDCLHNYVILIFAGELPSR